MKAVVQTKYGPPKTVLECADIPMPTLGEHAVLVHVGAAGLHVGDCFTVRGTPFLVRFSTGLFKPRSGVPGYDFAGRVVEVGRMVRHFQPGDEVFGACLGSCAEYVAVQEDSVAPRPKSLSVEEAAAIPTSGLAALQALRDVGALKPGQQLLVNGAAGGVGSFAVQIAKAMRAEVTGVCGTKNVEFVRSLGADHVIDYTRGDFTESTGRYDLILDNVENRALSQCRRALAPDGTLILNSGTGAKGLRLMYRLIKPLLLSPFSRQNLRRFISRPRREDLLALTELAEQGKIRPVVERTYPLHEVPLALSFIDQGHSRGKVVVKVSG